MKIDFEGIEVLNETEQVMIFKIPYKKEASCATINIMFYESKNEEQWIYNDNKIQKAIEELKNAHRETVATDSK